MIKAPVVHIHIPKTAGTSLRSYLEEAFDKERVLHAINDREVTRDSLETNDLVAGHFAPEVLTAMRWRPFQFTILRDPIAREMSLYSMFVRNLAPDAAAVQAPKCAARVLSTPNHLGHHDNGQTRQLAGRGWWHANRPKRTSAETLEAAKSRLANLDVFGLVEDMERSIFLLCGALDWPWRPLADRLNVAGTAVPAAFSREIDVIRRRNALDLALYDYARELFEDRWRTFVSRRLGATFAGQPFETLKPLLVEHLDAAATATRVDRLRTTSTRFTGAGGLFASGIQTAFWFQKLERSVRWLRFGSDASLWLPLARDRDWKVEIEYFYPCHRIGPGMIQTAVDGERQSADAGDPFGRPGRLTLAVYAAARTGGRTRLSLSAPTMADVKSHIPPRESGTMLGTEGVVCLSDVVATPL